MRAVKNSDLSCSVTLKLIGSDDYIKAGLGERKLCFKVIVGFNYPKVEILRGVEHIILIAKVNLLSTGETCVDAVNKGVCKDIFLLYPLLKLIAEVPEVGILKNTLLKVVAVSVDKLTGNKDKAGELCLEALFEKKGNLCGEGLRRSIGNFVLVGENNARLGGIGDNKSHLGLKR